jgi:GNAT superfamily N-acetyltransferase
VSTRLELVTGRVLRPAAPADAPRLVTMFERCSAASVYGRFLAPLRHFPASHLVDVVRSSPIRRSWVVDDLTTGHLVAVGSWFRNEPGPAGDGAELGLLVEDAHQGQGIGTALLHVLTASARDAGVTTLVGHTLADARHVHGMLRHLGPATISCEGHTCTLRVSIVDRAERDQLAG